MYRRFLVALAALLCAAGSARAQTPLTVERIMQDPDTWIGSSPSRPGWSEDGEWLYFWWNPRGEFPADSLYRVPVGGGESEQVSPAVRRAVRPIFDGWHHGELVYDRGQIRKVFADDGDLFLLHRDDGKLTRLTRTSARESGPRFTPDGTGVVYRSGDQLYRLDLETGATVQLTDLQPGRERKDSEPDARDAWLERQQVDLFDVIREREEQKDGREAATRRDEAARDEPTTYHFGDGRIGALTLDPTGRFVAFTVSERAERKGTLVQNYVTSSGYAEDIQARSKVGDTPSETRLYVQDLERDTTYQVDFTQLPGIYDVVPEHLVDEGVEVDSSKARAVSVIALSWSADGAHAVVDIEAFDSKDHWIVRLDPGTGRITTLDRIHDDAWVRGPWSFPRGWLPDGRTFWYVAEKPGWAHLYTVHVPTGRITQLTDGEFEVSGVELSRDGRTWYLTTSEDSPYERHLYRMPVGGGERVRLTELVGRNEATLHPDDAVAAVIQSFTTRPPELYLQPFGRVLERITHSTLEEWESYPWRTGEIVEIPASDGVRVPAQLFRPANPNGGAVIFVHGAGYTQNVHRWWPGYFREYMFHNLLADRGYTVLNIDYRASAGYGRDWRTAIYRHMGGRDLQDQVDGSNWLGTEFGIDPESVFIYGGSYGGFMTLMALLTEPEHFGAGAALRSVTDWAHYNHGYTSNILNTPVTDSLAYARSSPINFADGLEDPLLMAHGVIDDNVQYQDILRLVQRFIELGKTGWELASYPVERHGFTEPSSWTDEYRRILALIERTVGPDRDPR